MNSARLIRHSAVFWLVAIGNVSIAISQSQSPSQTVLTRTDVVRFYADAHPYMDEAIPGLKKTVHELDKLMPIPDTEQPSNLLVKVGAKADELLHKVPDLISEESVSETQQSLSQGLAAGCSGTGGCMSASRSLSWEAAFHYLLLSRPAANGRTELQEYRTKTNGKVAEGSAAPGFLGFISSWIIFSSANQVESHFRCVGQQEIDGHKTWVIAFAQVPDAVESPGVIVSGGESIPMLLQGIAWVDQSDFNIVQLRTDLLAPLPAISVQGQTANILFRPVHIAGAGLTLWLPQSVHAEMESKGVLMQEEHKYSKYRLYQAKSKIVPIPNR
jgi:hypothetical protein